MSKYFSGFAEVTNPAATDYVVGYTQPVGGGEMRVQLQNLSVFTIAGTAGNVLVNGSASAAKGAVVLSLNRFLTIGTGANTASFTINGNTLTASPVTFQNASVTRWQIGKTVGANFALTAYDAAGVLVDAPFSTGPLSTDLFTISRPVAANSLTSLTGQPLTLATLDSNQNVIIDPHGTGLAVVDRGTGALPSAINTSVILRVSAEDTISPGIQADGFGSTQALRLLCRLSSGTRAIPAATSANGIFVNIGAFGFGTALTAVASGAYQMTTPSLWSGTNTEVIHKWFGTPNGSTTSSQWLALDGQNGFQTLNAIPIRSDGPIVTKAYTVGTLPVAATYTYGIVSVSDATNAAGTSLGSAPTGGGSVKRMVYSNGSSWLLL